MQFQTFYTVATMFDRIGFGGAGDPQLNRNDAYDQFAECLDDDQPAMAIRINLHPETGALIGADDVTQEFRDEYQRISIERGYGDPFEVVEPTDYEVWVDQQVAQHMEDRGAAV